MSSVFLQVYEPIANRFHGRDLPVVRAPNLLIQNIRALLRERGQKQGELAFWMKKTETWASQALNGRRNFQLQDLDRIAEFFGLAAYQLFQPGISPLTERRTGRDRRSGQDRRVSHVQRLEAAARPPKVEPLPSRDRELLAKINALPPELHDVIMAVIDSPTVQKDTKSLKAARKSTAR